MVSSMTGEGVDDLLERLGLLAQEGATIEAEYQPTVVLRPGRPRFTVVRRADGGWEVSGRSVERWIQETDLEDDREVAQLQTRLKKEGVDRKLAALGAKRGDDVHIKGRVFEYVPDVDPAAPSEPVDA